MALLHHLSMVDGMVEVHQLGTHLIVAVVNMESLTLQVEVAALTFAP